jgi:glycosyltransferase involved in cell wall biosynthesis
LRKACASADVVICPTLVVKDDILRHEPSIAPERIWVIPHFTQEPRFRPEEDLEVLKSRLGIQGKRVILYFGKVRSNKGIEDMCEAYRLLPKKSRISLVIAGAPTWTERFITRMRSNYPDVVFPGYVEDPSLYYGIADIFCIYTPGFTGGETFALSLADAMRFRVPIVCSENPTFREVTNGFAFFARPHDPQALARVWFQALKEKEKAKLLAQEGYKFAESRYTIDIFRERIEHCYHEVLS